MNPNNPTQASASPNSQARSRLLPFPASRVGKLAACLILGVAALSQTARSAPGGPYPTPGSYGAMVLSNNPVAFWQLNETNSPSSGTLQAFDYTGHGYNGTYGTTAQNKYNGIVAPQAPPYPGFATGQGALQMTASDANSVVTIPPLNLNSATVTFAMWIKPPATVGTYTGLLMNRTAAGDAEGFGFGGTQSNSTTMAGLGYTWNTNGGTTWGFSSTLYPLVDVWQFVALVIRTNSATFYLYYVDPGTGLPVLRTAVNSIAHSPAAFSSGATFIGSDVVNGATPDTGRVFAGGISDVAVFNAALTADQILALFAKGLGVVGFAPQITTQPQSAYVLSGSTARMSATGISGTSPMGYQWQLNGGPLSDNSVFSGTTSNVLTIVNVAPAYEGTYRLVVTNVAGTTFSSPATLTIQAPALVGQWLDGSTAAANLADVSGYSPAGTHDAVIIGTGWTNFVSDVPIGKTGQSLSFFNGDTGLAITNSSTLDANYRNTFDNRINNAFSVGCWAKNFPVGWSAFVSKWGEGPPYNTPNGGWQMRAAGDAVNACFTVRDNNVGGIVSGTAVGGAIDDMASSGKAYNDGAWHLYAGTFDASTGVRSLWVDAVLVAQETNNVPYDVAPYSHVCINGKDSAPGNTFGGYSSNFLYDVRIYNYALAESNIVAWYGAVPAIVTGQPQDTTAFPDSPAQIRATVAGTQPLALQWQFNGTNIQNLADSTNFTGSNSTVLVILSTKTNDVGPYRLIVTNAFGSAISSNATLTIVQRMLVGRWLDGNASFADVSGYQPAGTHNGVLVGAQNYQFSVDLPPGKSGQSLYFNGADTALSIDNSATSDSSYTNTFDETINNAFTIAFWAKGWPGGWNMFVSKNGDSGSPGAGWNIRNDGNNGRSACFTIRGGGGNVTQGTAVYGNGEDLAATDAAFNLSADGQWHHLAGTYNVGTGIRTLYVDGVQGARSTNNSKYRVAAYSHVVIGGFEASPGGTFTEYFDSRFFDVRIYNYDLTSNQVVALAAIPDPSIVGQPPSSVNGYLGLSVQITATGKGTAPMTNQWQFNGVNLTNGAFGDAFITGADTSVLTITRLSLGCQGGYRLVVKNALGTVTSSSANLTVSSAVAPPAANLVGQWLTGAANLAETSGYTPAGTHNGFGVIGATTNTIVTSYVFSTDVPRGATGQSLQLGGSYAIAISNSSTWEAGYTNTFDDTINTNGMTVMCWAKGLPGGWNPWVSKQGETPGWQLRVNNNGSSTSRNPCWSIRGTGGADDMSSTIGNVDTGWHFYAGTYDPVTAIRTLYVDGALAARLTGDTGPISAATAAYLAIGGRDGAAGNVFGNYFSGLIYGVRIYNTALSQAQVAYFMPPALPPVPAFTSGRPVITTGPSGNQLVLTWGYGRLLSATNVAGPYLPVAGATSPYTNIISAAPMKFFRLINP